MIPKDAKVFALQPNSKVPPGGTRGHLDAVRYTGGNLPGTYGIALDSQWLLVDIDRPDDPIALEWELKLPVTWQQKTPRGTHRLYKLPSGFTGKNSRFPAGDLKVRGYLVGPGSEVNGSRYFMLNEQEPVDAPEWLTNLCSQDRPSSTLVNGELVFNERDKVAIGENDNELYALACYHRRRGLTEAAIRQALKGFVESGVVEQIPGNEYADRDFCRLARQAARYDPATGQLDFSEQAWECAADIPLVGPPIDWWVHGFIPRGELVTLYGQGGIGKSSFGSWLAARVTQRGGKFVFVGVEESFQRFAARAILGGAIRERLFSIPDASSAINLPASVPNLSASITTAAGGDGILVYFDSIYSHFGGQAGENSAERARKCLAPLAETAQRTGCTILAIFHENKAGTYLGSVEMINVARYALRAQRSGGGPLKVWVDKTNLTDPGCAMQFEAAEHDIQDPETKQIQYEVQEDGTLTPMRIRVLTRVEDCQAGGDLDDRLPPSQNPEVISEVVKMLESGMSSNDIYKEVGGRKQDLLAVIRSLKP